MIEIVELIKTFGLAFYFLSVTSALGIVLSIKYVIDKIRRWREDY